MTTRIDRSRFVSLDALRGLAATAIAVFHFSSVGWGGYLAVDFFLVLSGFILTHGYLYAGTVTHPVAFIGYRLARLYPLHIFTLLSFVVATLLTAGHLPAYPDGNLFTLLQQLTLTHNVGLNPGGMTWNYPAWSISVEFWVNVLFIFLVGRETESGVLLAVAMAGLLLVGLETGHLDTHFANYFGALNSGLIRGLSSFLLGVVCYRIYLRYKDIAAEGVDRAIRILEPASLLAVAGVVFVRRGNHSHVDFLAPFVFMIVVTVFAFERGWFARQLKRLSHLGTISYSIYLNQVTVLILLQSWLIRTRWPGIAVLAIYLSVLFGYSHFTYRYIEQPLRRKFRAWWSTLAPGK